MQYNIYAVLILNHMNTLNQLEIKMNSWYFQAHTMCCIFAIKRNCLTSNWNTFKITYKDDYIFTSRIKLEYRKKENRWHDATQEINVRAWQRFACNWLSVCTIRPQQRIRKKKNNTNMFRWLVDCCAPNKTNTSTHFVLSVFVLSKQEAKASVRMCLCAIKCACESVWVWVRLCWLLIIMCVSGERSFFFAFSSTHPFVTGTFTVWVYIVLLFQNNSQWFNTECDDDEFCLCLTNATIFYSIVPAF